MDEGKAVCLSVHAICWLLEPAHSIHSRKNEQMNTCKALNATVIGGLTSNVLNQNITASLQSSYIKYLKCKVDLSTTKLLNRNHLILFLNRLFWITKYIKKSCRLRMEVHSVTTADSTLVRGNSRPCSGQDQKVKITKWSFVVFLLQKYTASPVTKYPFNLKFNDKQSKAALLSLKSAG